MPSALPAIEIRRPEREDFGEVDPDSAEAENNRDDTVND